MNIPSIGGARGIFEIFIPGAFLLLNLLGFAYLSPFKNGEFGPLLDACKMSNSFALLGALVIVTLGYLLGMAVRLRRYDLLERLSKRVEMYFELRDQRRKNPSPQTSSEYPEAEGEQPPSGQESFAPHLRHYEDDFPYFRDIKEVSAQMNGYANLQEFYDRTWGTVKGNSRVKKRFFNFCKVLINAVDEHSSKEIFGQESAVRYIAGMFSALWVSEICGIVVLILRLIIGPREILSLALLLVMYALVIYIIVRNFRSIRRKEVRTVFAAHFINEKRIEKMLSGIDQKSTDT